MFRKKNMQSRSTSDPWNPSTYITLLARQSQVKYTKTVLSDHFSEPQPSPKVPWGITS